MWRYSCTRRNSVKNLRRRVCGIVINQRRKENEGEQEEEENKKIEV